MNFRCSFLYVLVLASVGLLYLIYNQQLASTVIVSKALFINQSTLLDLRNSIYTSLPSILSKRKEMLRIKQNATSLENVKSTASRDRYDINNGNSTDAPTNVTLFAKGISVSEERKKEEPKKAHSEHTSGSTPVNESTQINNLRLSDNINTTKSYYMTVTCRGRLGNQMFQYAALFGTVRMYPEWTPFLLDYRFPMIGKAFRDSLSIPRMNINKRSFKKVKMGIKAVAGLEKLKHLPKTNVKIVGYFQSHKYFEHAKNGLRKEFSFPRQIQDKAMDYFQSIAPQEWRNKPFVRVGIQVRRTDMATDSWQRNGWLSGPPSYFAHAMEYFRQKYDRVQFIVASDDLGWCRTYIRGNNINYSNHDYILDLAILSLSDHTIISVGTYSWWAGWLCKGTTIYYGVPPPENTYFGHIYANDSWIPGSDEYNHWLAVI